MGYGVWVLVFGVRGLGFGVWGLGSRFWNLGFESFEPRRIAPPVTPDQHSGFGIWGLCERGPPRAVYQSRHKLPGGLVN